MTSSDNDWFIAELVAPPSRDDEPGWVLHDYYALDQEFSLEAHGNAGMANDPQTRLAAFFVDSDAGVQRLVTLSGEQPADWPIGRWGLPTISAGKSQAPEHRELLGFTTLYYPRKDNLHLVEWLGGYVAQAHRDRGIGTAQLAQIEAIAAKLGRTHLIAGTSHTGEITGERLTPRTGTGAIRADVPGARLLLDHGYILEQVEQVSSAPLPVVNAAEIRAQLRLGDYEVRCFDDLVPEQHWADIAEMRAACSVDMPFGDISRVEENWDPERVERELKQQLELGHEVITGLVFAGDRAVALCDVWCRERVPELVHQEFTFVAADHRGHRLGLAAKLAVYEAAVRRWPKATKVQTFNASENQHMLSINRQIGFATESQTGLWQKVQAI